MIPARQAAGAVEFLLEARPLSGSVNMWRDEELLRQAEALERPATWIRFYRWDAPTVSLGKHQAANDAVDLEFCRRNKIPVVARPTGGRAVLHADELTYAVVSNDSSRFPPSIDGSYLKVAQALQAGFSRLGLAVDLAEETAAQPAPADRLSSPCFVAVSRHELACQGRKVAGSAQRRTRRAFLQHGSIPLTIDYELMAKVFRSDPEALQTRFMGIAEALGRAVAFMELAEALRAGFESTA